MRIALLTSPVIGSLVVGLLVVGVMLQASAGPVRAADLSPDTSMAQPDALLTDWEVRAGVLAHDPLSPEAGSADLNGEILFPRFWTNPGGFWSQFIPHPDLGFTANFAGKTSNLYGGAAWNFDLWRGTFLSVDFGGGVNNGYTGADIPTGHNHIGCNAWFHESASLGYRFTEHWSLMSTIEHSSNAGLCLQNRGVTNYGLRVGYRF